jgi:hypothetical protein
MSASAEGAFAKGGAGGASGDGSEINRSISFSRVDALGTAFLIWGTGWGEVGDVVKSYIFA